MKSFSQLHRETSALHHGFLNVELDTAFTLLKIAGTTQNQETRARSVQKAIEAHAAVLRSAPRVAMTNDENDELQSKLRLFAERLESLKSSEGCNRPHRNDEHA